MGNNPDKKLTVPKGQSWQMFNTISARYDLLNRLLSLGLDVSWRKRLSQYVPERPGLRLLDLATGTADVLLTLIKERPNIESGLGLDMAEKMLDVGRVKIREQKLDDRLTLDVGDANAIPVEDSSYDCTTMSFGIRNVEDPRIVMREMHRVLKPGGRTLILEFSMPKNPVIRLGHIFYLRTVVPLIGWLVSGQYKAYKYLNQTIEEFPYGDAFCRWMTDAGFVNVKANPLLFGVATIYQGDRG